MEKISNDSYWAIRKYFRDNPKLMKPNVDHFHIIEANRSRGRHYEVIEDITPSRWIMQDEIEVRREASNLTPYITIKNKLNEEADKVKRDLDFLTNYDNYLDKDLSENITKFILTLKN